MRKHILFGLGVLFLLAAMMTGVRASPIIDVNVNEYMIEDDNYNGFCWNCGTSTSGITDPYDNSVFGLLTDSNGTLTLKNTSMYTDLSDVVVYISDVNETSGWSAAACTNPGSINFWDDNAADGNIIIHMRDLPRNTSIDCNYDINLEVSVPPLVIYEDYNYRTIILGQANPIVVNLVNQAPLRYRSLKEVVITKTAEDSGNNGKNDFNFTGCAGLDGFDTNFIFSDCNASANAGQFTWDLNHVDINADHGGVNNPLRMHFTATEVDYNDHNTSGFYKIGTLRSRFRSTDTLTDLNVYRITAIAPSSLQVFKRQDPDANSGATYDGYDWGFNLAFTNNTQDVNFQINKMSMWVTIYDNNNSDFNGRGSPDPHKYLDHHDFRNPNQAIDVNKLFANGKNYMTMPAAGSASTCAFNNDNNHLECQANPANYKLGTGSTWWATFGEDIDANGWWIDKNLAGDPQNPDGNTPWIPVIWGDANFTIANDEYDYNLQVAQYSYSVSEFIYIIHDYIIEAHKDINRLAPNDYNIVLFVHNRGNKNTPQNVYVYDVIPNGFDLNHTPDPDANIFRNRGGFDYNALMGDGNQPIYATHGWDRNGIAYWWNVGPLDANSTGLRDEATIQYFVIGSGDYNAMNLFIVGVDPIQTDIPSHGSPVARLANLATTYTQEEQTMAPLAGAALIVGMLGGALIVIKP